MDDSLPIYQCIFCGDTNNKTSFGVTDIFGDAYTLQYCLNCSCYFLAPHPTTEQLDRAYDDTYYGQGSDKFNPVVEFVLDKFRLQRTAILRKVLPVDARVLDIGCGNGRFLQFLSRFGNFELHGIEPPGNSALRASKINSIHLITGTLRDSTYQDAYFDAITLFHVFEHLNNPKETLRTIHRILKPGGLLVLSFPNINSLQARWFKNNWLHLDPPRHLFFFQPNDLKTYMQTMGYVLVQESYLSMEQNPFGMVQSVLNALSAKREVLYEWLKGNKAYVREYGQHKLLLHIVFFVFSFPLFLLTDTIVSLFKKGATVQLSFQKK